MQAGSLSPAGAASARPGSSPAALADTNPRKPRRVDWLTHCSCLPQTTHRHRQTGWQDQALKMTTISRPVSDRVVVAQDVAGFCVTVDLVASSTPVAPGRGE